MESVKYIPGDLVKLDEEVCTIETIDRSKNHFDLLDEDGFWHVAWINEITPIPLTPQILEASGWKTQNGWYYFLNVVKGCIANIGIDFKHKADDGKLYVELNGNNIIRIEYCHQLQHLLFGLGLDSSLKV